MGSSERRLLRKNIDLKLYLMANKEAQENDFINSSKLTTERQEMYMIISKVNRRSENSRNLKKKRSFPIETTSLPHVNIGKMHRIQKSAQEIINNKKELKKVFKAHSFRTATPYYTNPNLTADRGNIPNFSQHPGVLLHTPKYIKFLKYLRGEDSSETESSKLTDTTLSEPSSSISGSTIPSGRSSSSSSYSQITGSTKTKTPSISQSMKTNSSTNDSIDRRPNSIDECLTNVTIEKMSSNLSGSSSERCEICNEDGSQNQCISGEDQIYAANSKASSKNEDIILTNPASRSITSSSLMDNGNDQNIILEVTEFLDTHQIDMDDIFNIQSYFETVVNFRDSKLDYVEEYCNFLLRRNKKNFDKFSKIVNKYAFKGSIKPEEALEIKNLLKDCKDSLSTENREMAYIRITVKKNTNEENITAVKKESEETNIPKKEIEAVEDFFNSSRSLSEQEDTDTYTNENDSTIYDNIKVENDDVKKEKILEENSNEDRDEDFSDSFHKLFRNSVPEIGKEEIDDLKKLVLKYQNSFQPRLEPVQQVESFEDNEEEVEEKEKEKEEEEEEDIDFMDAFNNLFRNSVDGMDENDLNVVERMVNKLEYADDKLELSDNDDKFTNENVVYSFRDLFRSSVGSISREDLDHIKSKFSSYRHSLPNERKQSIISYDENNFNESFDHLYRNSIDDMDEKDVKAVRKMIEKLEKTDEDLEWDNEEEDIVNEDAVYSYRDLFRNSVGSISKQDVEHVKSKFAHYQHPLERNRKQYNTSFDANDFSESFNLLYRNSIDEMDEKDMRAVQKMFERLEDSDNDLDWSDDEEVVNKKVVNSFRDLIRSSVGSISKADLDTLKSKFSPNQNLRENERTASKISVNESNTSDSIEENEKMMAFVNLFRSSVGSITEIDYEKINKLIEDHENSLLNDRDESSPRTNDTLNQ